MKMNVIPQTIYKILLFPRLYIERVTERTDRSLKKLHIPYTTIRSILVHHPGACEVDLHHPIYLVEIIRLPFHFVNKHKDEIRYFSSPFSMTHNWSFLHDILLVPFSMIYYWPLLAWHTNGAGSFLYHMPLYPCAICKVQQRHSRAFQM